MCDFRKPYFKLTGEEVPHAGNLDEYQSFDDIPKQHYYTVGHSGVAHVYNGDEDEIEWRHFACWSR